MEMSSGHSRAVSLGTHSTHQTCEIQARRKF